MNKLQRILSLTDKKLYKQHNHPICITKNVVYNHFKGWNTLENFSPVTLVERNFDNLLIPKNHPSRGSDQTYYIDSGKCLRTHTTAESSDAIRNGYNRFLICGDVYRKDSIDASHYPVFHQIEGVSVVDKSESDAVDELKQTLSELMQSIFGDIPIRWSPDHFPFTSPSFEMEIKWRGKWMEVLGCGLLRPEILRKSGVDKQVQALAFGLGLERLAMILFDIPDIRLFWTNDPRFTSQFQANQLTKFKPWSPYPAAKRDISFRIDSNVWKENIWYDLIREVCGDVVERVEKIDTWNDSRCFRIIFRSMTKSLTGSEIDTMLDEIRNTSHGVIEWRS